MIRTITQYDGVFWVSYRGNTYLAKITNNIPYSFDYIELFDPKTGFAEPDDVTLDRVVILGDTGCDDIPERPAGADYGSLAVYRHKTEPKWFDIGLEWGVEDDGFLTIDGETYNANESPWEVLPSC